MKAGRNVLQSFRGCLAVVDGPDISKGLFSFTCQKTEKRLEDDLVSCDKTPGPADALDDVLGLDGVEVVPIPVPVQLSAPARPARCGSERGIEIPGARTVVVKSPKECFGPWRFRVKRPTQGSKIEGFQYPSSSRC